MDISYRRAWLLVDALNRTFREPVVAARGGDVGGGGASLTPFGIGVIASYRAVKRDACGALTEHLAELEQALAAPPGLAGASQ